MERILLLEDDKSLVTGLTLALGRAGYALDTARTLAEAGHLWQAGRYDLLMLDVTLPDGTGFDFCREVRRTSGVPILFLTASDEEMDIITGLDLGGDDYITKPFKLGVLLSRVHALLRRAGGFGAQQATELCSGGIRVDLLAGRAEKNGVPLELTAAEYKLLCLFLRSPGQVLTKETILNALWDCEGNYVDTNTLTVYIRRLRSRWRMTPAARSGWSRCGAWATAGTGMCEMKFLVEDDVRQLFARLCTGLAAALLAAECASWALCPALCLPLLGLFVLLAAGVLGSAAAYFARRQKRLEEAAAQVRALLDGDATARLDSGREGQLYRLFHEVNEMAAVLNAHADREQREKQFLKNTMADISHQLKTPLAALNIYNGLLQAGTDDAENVRELAELSEQELDRMEQLVQSLLKLTRLDAGTVQLEKTEQDLQGLLEQTARPFACRARQEQKQLAVAAEQGVCLCCDRVWMREAVGNLIKNALDHTRAGDTVTVEGSRFADFVRIRVVDTGTGIHPEDLPHLFKRFYRSRFAQDTPGIGLGLPLAKSIVEVHGGTLEVESELGRGTAFTILLRNRPAPAIPTKL